MNKALVTAILLGAFTAAKPAEIDTLGPAANTSREIRWKEDLDYFVRELPTRHVQFSRIVPQKKFEREVREIERAVSRLTDTEIVLALMRQVAGLGVAHTRLSWPVGPLAFHHYPLGFYWFSDGLAVAAATPEYRQAVGARVLRIGSRTPQQVQVAVAAFVSHDNDAGLRDEGPVFMRVAEVLRYLKIADADGKVRLKLATPAGETLVLQFAPASAATQTNWVKIWDDWAVPRRTSNKRAAAFYWHEFLPEARALYLQYNVCANAPGHSFETFAQGLFACADTQPVARIVVDLRGNGGGDSSVVKLMLEGLKARPALSAKGHLYALIGRGTCSSGMMAALNLRTEFGAILVGEPTGGKPNAYGEVRTFRLPNSQLEVRYATARFQRTPQGDPPSLNPDLFVAQSLRDCLAGRDPVLEAALAHALH